MKLTHVDVADAIICFLSKVPAQGTHSYKVFTSVIYNRIKRNEFNQAKTENENKAISVSFIFM